MIIAHSGNGRALLSEHYGRDDIDWIRTELLTTADRRKFRSLHGRIVDACLVAHYRLASERRLNELTGGEYSAIDIKKPPNGYTLETGTATR